MGEITAEQAGKALRIVAQKLGSARILTDDGIRALTGEADRIQRERKKTSWDMAILRQKPITFNPAKDKNGRAVKISLISRITVEQIDEDHPPFKALELAVELRDEEGKPLGRWHVDKANKDQSGPRFHLQFGGHIPGHRDEDFPVKVPRWCHPPMDVALLCEVIAANFFEAAWSKNLRDDVSWCGSIRVFQTLCYEAYSKMISRTLCISDSTALGKMWGDRWHS